MSWSVFFDPTLGQAVVSGSPLILYTDFVDGATSGGENNKGGYLSVYGINFGNFSDFGGTSHLKIGGVEVDNYRCLADAVTTANGSPLAVKRLTVQVGSLGGAAYGTALQVTMTVGGVDSPNNDLDGNQLTFTPINAPIIFIDETNGNDANAGTIASPKQHVQTYPGSGSLMTGVVASNSTWNSGTQSGGIVPGTQVVLRGGTYVYDSSFQSRWVNLFRVTGTDPTSNASGGGTGVHNGYLKFTSYPGAAGANAPELAFYNQPAGGAGGFNGNDSARASENTPFGFSGYAQYWACSNLKVFTPATVTSTDQAPFNMQNSANYCRIVNCEASYPATGNALAGGIAGDCVSGRLYGNYIHDVGCNSGLQNHGIYLDGGALIHTHDTIVAYNYIKNITGGSGIQQYTNKSPTQTTGFTNNAIHHNVVDTVKKYGLNLADGSASGKWYENLVLHPGLYSIRINTTNSNLALTVMNNTCYDAATDKTGFNAMVTNEWNASSGYVEFLDNIFCLGNGRSNAGLNFYVNNATDSALSWKNNLYFDPEGIRTSAPTGATHTGELYGDPKFITNYTDFSLQASSPAVGAAASSTHLTVSYDLKISAQPRSGKSLNSIGAYA